MTDAQVTLFSSLSDEELAGLIAELSDELELRSSRGEHFAQAEALLDQAFNIHDIGATQENDS
jgi:hypothetical protein